MYIDKIVLINYRGFTEFSMGCNKEKNIIIGDNGVGKTTLLNAIQSVLESKYVEQLNFADVINVNAVNNFMSGGKEFEKLPIAIVEVYIAESGEILLEGKHNSCKDNTASGIKLTIEPNIEYKHEIINLIKSNQFPYEFYKYSYKTFADENYNGYSKIKKSIDVTKIDNSNLKDSQVGREFVKGLFYNDNNYVSIAKKKNNLRSETSRVLNQDLDSNNYRLNEKMLRSVENYLDYKENDISIFQRGSGNMAVLNNKNIISNREEEGKMNIILIEEPELHLTHTRMKAEIDQIKNIKSSQIFLSTHNNMITTSFGIKEVIQLTKDNSYLKYNEMSEEDQMFFLKKDNEQVLNFMLSEKVIIVEGPTEYIILPIFYRLIFGKELHDDNITLISAGSLSFKRYLNISKNNNNKCAVITDNDKNIEKIEDNYKEYENKNNIKIFYDKQKDNYTFEVSLYNHDNEEIINTLLAELRNRKLENLEWMLKNKTKFILCLAEYIDLKMKKEDFDPASYEEIITVPQYIVDSFTWINKNE